MARFGDSLVEADGRWSRGHLADEELMQLAKGGDTEAFALVYDRNAALALALARRLVGDRGWAEDIAQDAFLTIWRNRGHYRPERGSVRAWLLGILRHRAIDAQRRAGVRERGRVPIAGLEQCEPAVELTDAEVERRDQARFVRRALAGLPAGQRQAIALAYLGGLSQPEIADRLQVPLGTVKGRIRLGLERLRRDAGAQATDPTMLSLRPATHGAGAPARGGRPPRRNPASAGCAC